MWGHQENNLQASAKGKIKMPNLQTLITTGSFSSRQVSNAAQPCSKGGRFLPNESPKSVIKDAAIISPESASSESIDHCISNDMHRQRCHDPEDITSDESSTASSFKRTSEVPKLSTELLCEQEDDLRLRTLLQVGSSKVNAPVSGLEHKNLDQCQEILSFTNRSSMASAEGLESHRSSDSTLRNGTLGYPPSMVSEKRDESNDLETSELHGFTASRTENANKNREWRQVSLLSIASEPVLYPSVTLLKGQVPASKTVNASEAMPRKVPPAASGSQGEKRESNRQDTNSTSLFSDSESTRSFDSPRSASTHFSKMQDGNASMTTQSKARHEYSVTTVKGGRFSPRNVPGKTIKVSSKPSPSKWEDAQKWLISSVSGDTRQQADITQISSPRLSSAVPFPDESVYRVKSLGTDDTVCMRSANKLDNPTSQGSLRQIQAFDKRTNSSYGYVLKGGEIAEKPKSPVMAIYDQKQKPLLESRTTKITDTLKLSIVNPTGNKTFQSAAAFTKNNVEAAATVLNSLQPGLAGSTTVKFPAGQRASLARSDAADLRNTERLSYTTAESCAASNMVSSDVHMTDKYADTVVQTPDHDPPSALYNEFFVQTPKVGDSLPMKDVSTEVTELVSRYRDMGTQMTPLSSSRPSKCTTPNSNISPARHNTPAKQTGSLGHASLDLLQLQSSQLMAKLEHSDLSLQSNLNTLERTTSNTWSTREEEEEECSKSLRYVDITDIRRSVVEARATAWEEAEQAKSKARYKREESKIQAWENHQKAKAEAEMRKLEVKLEKMRSHQIEKIMNKLSASHQQAENMKAVAQAEQAEQIAKSKERANQMRLSGQVPTPICACFPSHT